MPYGDVLIHAGDFTELGLPSEVKKFNEWLGRSCMLSTLGVLGRMLYLELPSPIWVSSLPCPALPCPALPCTALPCPASLSPAALAYLDLLLGLELLPEGLRTSCEAQKPCGTLL